MSDDEMTQKACAKRNLPRVIENVPESLCKYVAEESVAPMLEMYKKVENGEDASCDVWYKKTPTMPRHCVRVSYTVTKDENGKAVMAHAIGQNITMIKQEEEKYASAYKQLLEAHPATLASFHLNLTKNWYGEGVSSMPFVLKLQEPGTVDGYFREFSKLIADERVKDEFFRTFNREKLLKEYLNGKTKVSIKYPIVYQDGTRHMRDGQLYMLQNPKTGDIEAYTYAIDIDEEMDFENMVKAVSSGACGFIIVLDMTNGRIRFGGDTSEGASESYRNEDYTAPMVKALQDMMPADKLDEAIRAHSVENIRRELEDKSLYQITLETKDGRYFHWRISYIDKERTVVLIMRSDITEAVAKERSQEKLLQAALDSAEKANEAKSAFLSSMSHDLRTPLSGVLGFTQFALKEKDQLKKQSYLEKIDSSGKLLLDLVNDTLELSRIESGKMTLDQETVMSDELVPAVVTSLRPAAELKGVRLIGDFDAAPNVPVWCDKLKVNKIILNLVSNAIKYTHAGGRVTVSLKPLPTGVPGCTESLIIEDTGIGMSKEFMKHMYEPFSQEKRSESANVPGTGLGLAIVKRYVDLMGGSISVTSVLHKGTRWVVSLPIGKNSDSIARKREDEEAVSSLSGLRVLLCEDNEMNLEIATMLLQDKCILADTAENGQIGLDKFTASEAGFYDAVLTDIRMPQMDGCEMSRRIRALDRSDAQTVPIIAMTADAFEESVCEAKAAGINGYVTKPIVPNLLYKALVNALKSG